MNVVRVNEWLNFIWKSDDIMQDNLKVHFTQENNEADYLVNMRKPTIFLKKKKETKPKINSFLGQMFHSFSFTLVYASER